VGTGTKYTYTATWNQSGAGTGRICEHNAQTGTTNQASSIITFGYSYGFNGQSNDAHFIVPMSLGTQISTVMRVDNSTTGYTANGNNNIRFRSNGTNYPAATTSYSALSLNNYWFAIGRKASANSEFFNGSMKNVMVFKDAISDADTIVLDTWQQSI
jgi:hypothetical protein